MTHANGNEGGRGPEDEDLLPPSVRAGEVVDAEVSGATGKTRGRFGNALDWLHAGVKGGAAHVSKMFEPPERGRSMGDLIDAMQGVESASAARNMLLSRLDQSLTEPGISAPDAFEQVEWFARTMPLEVAKRFGSFLNKPWAQEIVEYSLNYGRGDKMLQGELLNAACDYIGKIEGVPDWVEEFMYGVFKKDKNLFNLFKERFSGKGNMHLNMFFRQIEAELKQ